MSEKPDMQVEEGKASYSMALPEQKAFFKIPARFGHVPVAEEPLGYDHERRFEQHYPRIELPFQLVDTVETGVKRRYEKDELFRNGLNRIFFGDCLHVMRMLPSECIDLIYIDPPFFSGRNYNIIFGDKNEVRSFTDIWEGGMPGYLIWLNARLYEMKRLLKPTGTLYVHLDWHAVHYVKCELDRIFGADNFINQLVWQRQNTHNNPSKGFSRLHDVILFYSKGNTYTWNIQRGAYSEQQLARYKKDDTGRLFTGQDLTITALRNDESRRFVWRGAQPPVGRMWAYSKDKLEQFFADGLILLRQDGVPRLDGMKVYLDEKQGKVIGDIWIDILKVGNTAQERIGYPTQKPEALLERIITASSNEGDVVADFFSGGGTTVATAQKNRRRWIGSDISRVAVALTADRIARILAPNLEEIKRAAKKVKKDKPGGELDFGEIVENGTLTTVEESKKKAVEASTMPLIGYTVEHWGIYEINRLTKLSGEEFRAFVVACYGARKWTGADANIQGVKAHELLWVAGPKETDVITATDVKNFAQAVMKTRKPEERQAVMIGWGVDPKARAYAEQVMRLGEAKPIQFIKLRLWPLAGDDFKAHVTRKHDKHKDFFAFILPPDIPRIGVTRIGARHYRFDVSEARSMNTGGKIVNVQWDFDFRDGIFSATQGYQLCRKEIQKARAKAQRREEELGDLASWRENSSGGFEGQMTVEYSFEHVEPRTEVTIACRVQDDLGGEGMKAMKLKVE
ncbi:MAG: site-specific DNA-methyltransferase [Verrucomicrobiota bacterium]|nr:site-specific DNA-methyltransferase [Verrucomicrobiota bacterium]